MTAIRSETRSKVTFKRASSYHEASDCGGYTVCAIGGRDGVKFEAWRGKQQLAVNLETAEEAREVCRVDAKVAA